MRGLLVILAIATLAGCPRTLSDADRVALQDFRTVERACLVRARDILRDESMHLSDASELQRAVRDELVKPWQEMRARVRLSERKLGDDLAKVLGRYFDEREIAWTALAKAIDADAYGTRPEVNHRWQYRESDEAANADQQIIEAKLAALKLPPLPPLADAPIVDLVPPPPVTTPGAAYFLSGRSVIRLDDRGFRTIATDVDTMDVLPDGTMWACSTWHVAYWDGTKTTDHRPKIPSATCAAGPDGALWVVNDRYHDDTHDQLGRFDGKTWKVVPAFIGDVHVQTDALMLDREGRLYAVSRDRSGGSDAVWVHETGDRSWRQIAIQRSGGRLYLNHLFRGGDGHVWATYDVSDGGRSSTGFARLAPRGSDAPVYAADYFQAEQMHPFVDAAGVFTVLDPRRNVLEQAKQQRKLPLPVAHRYFQRDTTGPFTIDGAGRIWIDLVDGINVIERGGKRTVYPRGSVEGLHENTKTIVVTGAGPSLVAPGPVATRTIQGQIRDGGKLELAMCGDAWGRECLPGLPAWKAFSDAEGNFTFENVPRWTFEIFALAGVSGGKRWQRLDAECCKDKDVLEPAGFHREVY